MFSRAMQRMSDLIGLRDWLEAGRKPAVARSAAARKSVSEYDAGLLWSALLLLTIGLIMVYSSSIAMSEVQRFTGYRANYFLLRHIAFVALSLVVGMSVFQVPMRVWQQAAPWLFIGGVLAFGDRGAGKIQ